jgi:hypothetical protein
MSMGIYVKNMKAPVTCCHCPLMGYDPDIEWADGGMETQGAYICVITHELIDNTKREEHCPLIPVPPHGRLIDADATEIYKREELAFARYNENQDDEFLEGIKDGWHEAAKCLSCAPAIIPAEPCNNLSKPCKEAEP